MALGIPCLSLDRVPHLNYEATGQVVSVQDVAAELCEPRGWEAPRELLSLRFGHRLRAWADQCPGEPVEAGLSPWRGAAGV